jgi:cytochrome c oxidase subunit 4
MNPGSPTFRQLFGVFAALVALLATSAAISRLPPGWWSSPASLLIAALKVMLISWIFMRLGSQAPLVRVFAGAGLFWLGILIVLAISDFRSRDWPAAQPAPAGLYSGSGGTRGHNGLLSAFHEHFSESAAFQGSDLQPGKSHMGKRRPA